MILWATMRNIPTARISKAISPIAEYSLALRFCVVGNFAKALEHIPPRPLEMCALRHMVQENLSTHNQKERLQYFKMIRHGYTPLPILPIKSDHLIDNMYTEAINEKGFHSIDRTLIPSYYPIERKAHTEQKNEGLHTIDHTTMPLAQKNIYQKALLGRSEVVNPVEHVHFLRNLALRHMYAGDDQAAYNYLIKAQSLFNYSEDLLLLILLNYGNEIPKFINQVAQRNLDVGQYLMGNYHLKKQNYTKAYRWFDKAYRQGLPEARLKLEECKSKLSL